MPGFAFRLTAFIFSAAIAAAAASAQEAASPLEIRFCGQQALHAYSLSSEAGMQGVLLQQMAVANGGAAPVEIVAIELDLMRDGQALDTRRIPAADIEAFGKISQQIQAAPSARSGIELICGEHLVPRDLSLGGPTLAGRQAMMLMNQLFAYDGRRDALRVRVLARSDGGEVRAETALPISTAMSKNHYIFPLKGVWMVKSGPSLHTHHRWAIPQEFGLDMVIVGPDGRTHDGDGTRFADYHAYGADVLAAADGLVVKAVNDQPEPTDYLLRPGESFAAYGQRTAAYGQTVRAGGVDRISGNHVIIDHGNGEYGFYAHLRPGSVRVRVGDQVRAGTVIGSLGGSGNALVEPHLHFHLCDRPVPLQCAGIPIDFRNIESPSLSFQPRPVQSGDIIIAK